MNKNYTFLNGCKAAITALPFNNIKSLLIALVTLFGISSSFGQVVAITKPNLTINTCVFPSAYSVLGQIQIQESANGNFSSNAAARTLILTAPANFEFNPGVGTLTVRAGRDVNTAATMTVTATTITITYNCLTITNQDRLRLDLIEVRAINFASTGDITRTGGTGTVNGLINGTTLTNTLTSTFTPAVANGGGAATVCVGATTPAFTNATGGGTWSITNGTGSATISGGGVVTGTGAGTVTVVYTVGGCSSNSAVTVNAVPTITTQPVVTSICTTGTGTFSVVATGATTYQWRRNGVALTNVAPYSGVTTATLTITNPAVGDAGNFDVVVGNGTCSVTSTARALTVTTVPTITTNPANSSIGIGANTSFTAAGNNTPSSYTWQVSTNGGGTWTTVTNGGVYSNATTGTLNITGATIGMNGYLYHASATNACGTSAYSTNALLTVALSYCTPTATTDDATGITNVTFNTINNTTTGTAAYTNTGLSTTVTGTVSYPLSVSVNTAGNFTVYVKGWIDWNSNGLFTDPGEEYDLGSATNVASGISNLSPLSISIPNTTGSFNMRVRATYNVAPTSCNNQNYSEAEDYTIVVTAPVACVAPTAQPTSLALTPAGTTINGTFTAAAPAPNNYLVIANTTGVAPTIVNGTTYTIGSGALGGTNVVIDTDGNTNFSASSLVSNTTYYFFVYSMNDLCTGGPLYNTTSPLTGNATTSVSYCIPTSTFNTYPISNVTFAGINNNSSAVVTPTPVYQDFSAITGNVTAGSTYNISVTSTGLNPNPFYQYVFFDWNNNGDFTDDGGAYNIGNFTTNAGTFNTNITIPLTAYIGVIRMRVVSSFNGVLSPCATTGNFQMEDYSLNIVAPPPCVAPTAAPTALILTAGTPSGTAINGSFTAAAPVPNGYLVVVSTSNVAPTPVNGTTYTIGGNVGAGYTVVDTDTNTTFIAGGLNPSTTYYFYVYSMNNICSGGPLYYNVPRTGNLTTGATLPTYCNATTLTGQSTRYIDDISFLGMLNGDIVNLNTGFTTTPAPGGFQDWTGIAIKPIQAQGGGVNVSFESNSRGTWKAWVDWNKDGDFTDAGEMVYTSAGVASITNTFGFIIPTGATPGNYRIRIRTYNAFGNYDPAGSACDNPAYEYYGDGANHFDSCTQFTSYSQNITSSCGTASVNFTEYGETEDYLFTVVALCEANIVTVTDGEICGPGTVNVSVTGTAGTTQFRWYSAQTAGSLLATTATGNWTTPSIGATTSYWVTAFNGSCESLVRTEVIAKISPLPTISFTPSVPEVCGENNIVSITASGDTELMYLIDENFEGAGLGVFTNNHITSTAYNTQTAWQRKTSTLIPNGSSWFPAISSNFGANHFALVTSDIGANAIIVENALLSPVVNSNTFLDLTLTFRMYYSRYYPDSGALQNPTKEYMQVEVSTNSGTTWTSIIGSDIITDQGIGTRFKDFSYNMNAYVNKPNLRIRIRYYASDWFDGAAVDDVQLYGTKPLNTSFDWVSVLPVDAYKDLACTLPYTTGTPAVTVYIKPTLAQLELTTYSFTASATLNNGCSASSPVTIDNKSKVWKGGTNGDWNNANNWSPVGVPDATNCVIIPPAPNNSLVGGTNYNGFGKTLQVINGGNLKIDPTNTVTITDFVEVRGATSIFNIENSGSLIQVNNVPNIGKIIYKRTANIRKQDYVYWSAPVASFASNAISPGTSLGYQYKWLPTTGGFNNFGNWTYANETMVLGKGYIVRGPDSYTNALTNYTATFTGIPNNGNITIPISRGSYNGANYPTGVSTTPGTKDDDNWNLVGNPYPSAIDAKAFLALNTNIDGFVNIWTHGTLPSTAIADPFYNDYLYNYTPTDYITYNSTGISSGAGTFNGFINAGQGFFVSMLNGTAGTTENLIYNNSLRSNTYSNNAFYKTSNNKTTEELESHRIWFDIVSPSGNSVRALLGYAENATNDRDRLFDAFSNEKLSFNIYSLINTEKMLIQGRQLPFDNKDKVKIGVSIPQDGLYKIALSSVDGLFLDAQQNIYLEDKLLNVIYNLKAAPYSFMGNKGEITDRFVLRFAKDAKNSLTELTNQLVVYDNKQLNVESGKLKIKNIQVFDLLGKQIFTKNDINKNVFEISNLARTNSLLIVKTTLEDNSEEVRKVIY